MFSSGSFGRIPQQSGRNVAGNTFQTLPSQGKLGDFVANLF
jgi:hypothetical protein